MTTVSIVIVNYNYAQYLATSIQSALDQGAHEVIVVDDGSTDDSRVVIDGFSERIKAVHKSNGGHSSAVNAGYQNSTGDVVVFLDADDVVLPGAVEAIQDASGPAVSKVQWGLRTIDGSGAMTGHVYPEFTVKHTPEWCRTQLSRCSWYDAPPTSGNAWSRSFLSRIMPLPEGVGSSGWALDDYLHLLAPSFGDVVSLPTVLGEYRVHDKQMSGLESALLDRIEWVCSDEALRYELVNEKRAELSDQPALVPMRWSHHALNRLLLRKSGRDSGGSAALLIGYLRAFAIADTTVRSKLVNSAYGLALVLAPQRAASWLVRKRLEAAAAVFAGA